MNKYQGIIEELKELATNPIIEADPDTGPADPPRARGSTRVAYFTNVYPKPSHSFIRREILALERQGVSVERFSIRTASEPLLDREDQSEAARTRVLLKNRFALASDFAITALTRPVRLMRATAQATRSGVRSSAGMAKSMAYLIEACRLSRLMKKADVRHVHVHFGTNPAAIARLARTLTGITYSMTLHGPEEFDAPVALNLPEKIEDAAFVVAISSFGRGQLMRWVSPEAQGKIKVVRCGVDQTLLQAPHEPMQPSQRNTLVCVARLSAQKGLNLLLDAVADLVAEHDFELRIIGDGELRPALEDQIRRLGLQRHVTLVGWCDGDGVRQEILNARALVLPSLAEGLPVVLMEALALGRPVVATCVAGIPELVDERCGCLIPSGSEAALGSAIEEVLSIPVEQLSQMGEVGRERVQRRHDVDRNAANLRRLLERWA